MVTVAFPGLSGMMLVPEIFTILLLEDFREIFPSVFLRLITAVLRLLCVSVSAAAVGVSVAFARLIRKVTVLTPE